MMPIVSRWKTLFFAMFCTLAVRSVSVRAASPNGEGQIAPAGKSHALIIVGLAGDDQHEAQFRTIVNAWSGWLTQTLQFPPEQITVLTGLKQAEADQQQRSTAEGIARAVTALQQQLVKDDRLWVFVLGHADHDTEEARLHLPGRDINQRGFSEQFSTIECREQVFWLTQSCSGWFVESLSRKGRIVIAATAADFEPNETEFPQALAKISQTPPKQLDRGADGRVSIAELFAAIDDEVKAIYKADNRAPTEHAQLDDDGDGKGTESSDLAGFEAQPNDDPKDEEETSSKSKTRDGALAASTFLPLKQFSPKESDSKP